jgi:restriction system protein
VRLRRGRESFPDDVRLAIDHHQIGAHGTIGLRPPLLPVADTGNREPKLSSKLGLGQSGSLPDRFHVDIRWNMHAIGGRIGFPACYGNGTGQAFGDPVEGAPLSLRHHHFISFADDFHRVTVNEIFAQILQGIPFGKAEIGLFTLRKYRQQEHRNDRSTVKRNQAITAAFALAASRNRELATACPRFVSFLQPERHANMRKYPPPNLTPEAFELEVKSKLDGLGAGLADYRSEHREVVAGADGEYEIDITVRFTALGANFLVLVECKHYRRPVGREKVQALFAKMQSIGAHKGLMFATNGFQSGAIEFADAHGIALVELVDGRNSWIRKSADFNGPVPWSEVPDYVPRIVGWLRNGDTMCLVAQDRLDALMAFLKR